MIARAIRLSPLDAYVSAVIAVGTLCTVGLTLDGADDLRRLVSPEAIMFFVFAFAGEFVPLKVFTRGAEGEVTTSTTFALAAMLVAGPLAGLVALGAGQHPGRRDRPQAAPEDRVQLLPVRDHRRRHRARAQLHDRSPARRGAAPGSDRPARRPARRGHVLPREHRAGVHRRRARVAREGLQLHGARPVLPGLDQRPDARPGADHRARRRLRAAGDRAAVPADLRRPPRRPRGDREGAPGAPRRAHRAARTASCSAIGSIRSSAEAAEPASTRS